MIRRRHTTLFASAVLVSLALLAAACGSNGDDSASGSPATTKSGTTATVAVANTNLGGVLVDSRGRTLYLFGADSGTKSACSGACAVNWPPLMVSGAPTVGSGAKASLVGTSTRSDGKKQVTYNGHPVYLFAGDQKAGDTNGQGVNAFGGSWYALTSAGDQASGQASSSGSGSSGY
jgi:predicted lipoprotein with Yx(FWY)xxD motif